MRQILSVSQNLKVFVQVSLKRKSSFVENLLEMAQTLGVSQLVLQTLFKPNGEVLDCGDSPQSVSSSSVPPTSPCAQHFMERIIQSDAFKKNALQGDPKTQMVMFGFMLGSVFQNVVDVFSQ